MAKLSKKSLAEFDAAVDQLGGGAPPLPRPSKRSQAAAKPRKVVKAKARAKKR
jgi:hypothetical protein